MSLSTLHIKLTNPSVIDAYTIHLFDAFKGRLVDDMSILDSLHKNLIKIEINGNRNPDQIKAMMDCTNYDVARLESIKLVSNFKKQLSLYPIEVETSTKYGARTITIIRPKKVESYNDLDSTNTRWTKKYCTVLENVAFMGADMKSKTNIMDINHNILVQLLPNAKLDIYINIYPPPAIIKNLPYKLMCFPAN